MEEAHEMELPEHIAEALEVLVNVAEKHKVLTIYYRKSFNDTHYGIAVGENTQSVAKVSIEREDCLWGLYTIGFIIVSEKSSTLPSQGREIQTGVYGRLYLTEKAYEWVRYRRKWWIERLWLWLIRAGRQTAPLFVAIAAVTLTILQIFQTVLALLP